MRTKYQGPINTDKPCSQDAVNNVISREAATIVDARIKLIYWMLSQLVGSLEGRG